MTTNRIEEILRDVRAEIEDKRAKGLFGVGYEADIEDGHNRELGKQMAVVRSQSEELQALVIELQANIGKLSEIERDRVKFPPLRFLRELAMSRHQLIRLNKEVREISRTIQAIAEKISQIVESDLEANEKKNELIMSSIYERSLVMDKMIVVTSELEARLNALENK